MGAVVWGPTGPLIERGRRAKKRLRNNFLILALLGAAVIAAAAQGPGLSDTARMFVGAAGLLSVGFGVGQWMRAGDADRPWLAVLERGVLMPASFASAPGLGRIGPPCLIPLEDAENFDDLKRPEGRAVLVWTDVGTGGFVSNRIGAVEMDPDEVDGVLDGFVEALQRIGVRRKGGPEEPAEGEGAEVQPSQSPD
jgi:hypothetical protein